MESQQSICNPTGVSKKIREIAGTKKKKKSVSEAKQTEHTGSLRGFFYQHKQYQLSDDNSQN